MNLETDSFLTKSPPCLHPFISGTIGARYYKMCCADRERFRPKAYTNLDEWWNNEYIRQVRKDIFSGKVPYECLPCIKSGNPFAPYSFEYAERIRTEIPWIDKDGRAETLPTRITVVPSNKCNLACKMCSEDYSVKLGDKTLYELNGVDFSIIEQLAPTLREVNLTGGEALLDKKNTRRILDILWPYRKQIRLVINTNGHFRREPTNLEWSGSSWVEKIWDFASVYLSFSVDGALDVQAKQRVGFDRDKFLANYRWAWSRRIVNQYHRVGLHLSVSSITIDSLPEFVTELHHVYEDCVDWVGVGAVVFPFNVGVYYTTQNGTARDSINRALGLATKIPHEWGKWFVKDLEKLFYTVQAGLDQQITIKEIGSTTCPT